jgi:hypothetical protein
MRSVTRLSLGVLMAAALAVPVFAGKAHYTTLSGARDGNTITVEFKVAGLGDIEQIFVEITADAACVNPGSNKPKAANKESFSAGENVPVQNGHADGTVELTATFSPDCSPPMSVEFSNVQITVYGTNETSEGVFEKDPTDVLIRTTTVPL